MAMQFESLRISDTFSGTVFAGFIALHLILKGSRHESAKYRY